MNIPGIDKRKKQDIIDQIQRLAQSYTPEWRFSEENPDLGSVLGILFADMFAGTVDRYNNVLYKHHIAFLNNLDIGIKPSVPAKGIVCFEQSADFISGVYVPSKTKLLANSENTEESLVFETQHGIFVSPAKISNIIYHSPQKDKIVIAYDGNDEIIKKNISLFNVNEGENIQRHLLVLSHMNVLGIEGNSRIEILFEPNLYDNTILERTLASLSGNSAKWSYYHDGAWTPFDNVLLEDKTLVLESRDLKITPEEYEGTLGCWIGCNAENINPGSNIVAGRFTLKTQRNGIAPEVVYIDDIEGEHSKFHPFGEELSLYRECYIACKEAFDKLNSKVTISFDLSYTKLEKEYVSMKSEVDWKLIMKRKAPDYIPEKKTVVCDRVIWEYWNGLGWAKLSMDENAEAVFNNSRQGRVTLSFTCPEDMVSILVGAYESFWIRIRLVVSKDVYSTVCCHYSPVVSNMSISYSYLDGCVPEKVIIENNTVVEQITSNVINGNNTKLFKASTEKENSVYIALNRYPEGSPLSMYFNINGRGSTVKAALEWQYYSGSGWKELKISDRTDDFTDPGIVTILIPEDLQQAEIFGRNGFWIRIIDVDNTFSSSISYPNISGIFINAVEVLNKETMEEEVFFVDEKKANMSIDLSRGNILDLSVFVNEHGVSLDTKSDEYKEMLLKDKVEIEKDSFGNINGIWLQWNEVENFINSGPEDRHYVVDRTLGRIGFGDGKKGMIPQKRIDEAIRVKYSIGGGNDGNLEPGSINRMADAMRFIGRVYNPVSTHGGANFEDVETAVNRGANLLMHCNRAVTEEDFNALAMEASRSISKVKCVSNVDRDGRFSPGTVTIAILLNEYNKGRNFFLSEREKVSDFLCQRASSTFSKGMINVVDPVFIKISTKLWLRAKEVESIYEIQRAVRQRIKDFIDPITGNFNHNGWLMGELPNKSQIISYIKSLKFDITIERLIMTVINEQKDKVLETDIDDLEYNPFYLAVNGQHDITISYE